MHITTLRKEVEDHLDKIKFPKSRMIWFGNELTVVDGYDRKSWRFNRDMLRTKVESIKADLSLIAKRRLGH